MGGMTVTKRVRRPDLTARTIRRLTRALASIQAEARRPELTERRRAHAVLESLANLPVAILIADNRGRYVDANRAAIELTGYSRRELLTRSVWDLTPDVRQPLGRRLWREFLERGRMAGWYQVVRSGGQIVRARYVAVANVLPGIHVSALVTGKALRARRSQKA
jgi:PAS domain S-box-containing protein